MPFGLGGRCGLIESDHVVTHLTPALSLERRGGKTSFVMSLRSKALGLAIATTAIIAVPVTVHAAPPAGYKLTWSDEFHEGVGNQPSRSDWDYQLGKNNANNELEVYTDDKANAQIVADPHAVDGQALRITATNDGGVYHSARMTTGGKHDFKFGFIESRIKLPYGQGMWPAFWMLGSNIGQVGWPSCGEIDIMENIGPKSWWSHNQASLHSQHSGGHGTFDLAAGYDLPTGTFKDSYHTFQLWWMPDSMSFYIDGELYETRTKADYGENPYPFNDPEFILFNLAVGGGWPGNPDSTTIFPMSMMVDYVRVYSGTPHKPPTPLHATATASEGKQITLKWQSNINATGYNLYRGTTPKVDMSKPYRAGLQTFTFTDLGLTELKRYYYRVQAVNPAGVSAPTPVLSAVAPKAVELPYHGKAAVIPGRIEAADFDRGGEGLAYHDTDATNNGHQYRPLEGVDIEDTNDDGGGHNVGYTAAGEWLRYTVNVKKSGTYTVSFRVASANNGGTLHIEDSKGKNLTGAVTAPGTGGWQAFQTVSVSAQLKAGKQVLKLVEDAGGYNLHYIAFKAH